MPTDRDFTGRTTLSAIKEILVPDTLGTIRSAFLLSDSVVLAVTGSGIYNLSSNRPPRSLLPFTASVEAVNLVTHATTACRQLQILTADGRLTRFWPRSTSLSTDTLKVSHLGRDVAVGIADKHYLAIIAESEPQITKVRLLTSIGDRGTSLEPRQTTFSNFYATRIHAVGSHIFVTEQEWPFRTKVLNDKLDPILTLNPLEDETLYDRFAEDRATTWRAQAPIRLPVAYLQVIADIASDDRIILYYDSERGNLRKRRQVRLPLGLVDAMSNPPRVLGVMSGGDQQVLIIYDVQDT